ncbi:AAA family ATPase [Pseudomonas abieticivorans]|uniref:AAA family ATPase n=1 Tax=Pseudomonas abieticivorans TaxID=2931382 RepID=UPI0020BF1B38|nr:AAA family ATPase [Pseudomonas sp. PIA16]
MKILAIRLKNLASLAGPFEIDFTAQPLASAGLFAITGPTGAGKSTLLDALCLALFGAVPRLNNTGRDAKVPDADGEIATGDPRTLLRRGTGAGYAEVDFVGIDGRRYRARWEANRARDKAGAKLQASRQSLRDLDNDQLLASQKGEYKTLLEARLGLNFEQFTRAVLLAQSEFSAFLKADDNERSELLEKLTDTALYTRLGKRAYEKAREAREAHKQLQDQAGGIAPLEPQARAELDAQYNHAVQQLREQQAKGKQLEQQQHWHRESLRLQGEQHAAQEQLHSAEQAWQHLSEARANLSQLEQLAPQRHLFIRRDELQQALTPLAERTALLQATAHTLQHRQAELQQARQQAQAALEHALATQQAAAPGLRQAFDEHSHLSRLNQQSVEQGLALKAAEQANGDGQQALHTLIERQAASDQQLQRIAAQLTHSTDLAALADAWSAWRPRLQQSLTLSARLRKGQQELPLLAQRAADAERQLAEQQQGLDALYADAQCSAQDLVPRLAELTTRLQGNRQHLRSAEELQRQLQRLDELDQRQQALRSQQQQALEQRDARTREGLQLKSAHQAAVQALDLTVQLLQRQRLARSASVEELRGQLQSDQPCPVCGSAEHPWHEPQALLEALAGHDDSEERKARDEVERIAARLAELRAEVAGLIDQQKQLKAQEQPLQTQQEALLPAVQTHPLYATRAGLNDHLQQLAAELGADEHAQQRLLTLQQDTGRLAQQLQASQQAQHTGQQQLAEQRQQMAHDQQRLDEELDAFASVLPPPRVQAFVEDAANAFLHLDQAVAARLEQLDQRQGEQQENDQRRQRIDQQQLLQQGREQSLLQLRQEAEHAQQQRQACQQRLGELLGDHADPQAWQTQVDQSVQHARHSDHQAGQQLQAVLTETVQVASELKSLAEQQLNQQQSLQALHAIIDQWRSQHPQLTDEALHALLSFDAQQLAALRQQLQQSDTGLEQAKTLLQERQQKLQAHQAQANGALPSDELDTALLALQADCAACEDACAELRAAQAEDQRRLAANQHLQVLIDSALGQYQRWARLAALIGSATGDAFRKIAQAYNLDLLVHHANVQLRQLVRRYRLKRGGSMLGLLVVDTEMGDEARSVHSLSGGETFLVSLALALGLASMASSTLKIESLFIDEGFGSLDPESLQLAMDALDGLQAQGRKVAVISHVQEMHERIPVQIQVRRQGNGLSTVEVSG